MQKRRINYLLLAILMLMMCIIAVIPVSAESGSGAYSLTMEFKTESGELSGAPFRIYDALTADGELNGSFAQLDVAVGDLTSSEDMSALAYTLASYAASEQIEPYASGDTDSTGSVKFSGLTGGIYLVVGDSVESGEVMYTPKPVLIRIPGFTPESDVINDVVAEVKYDHIDIPPEPISRTVKKVWEDNNDPSRPTTVKVTLMENGKAYDEVELSESNNWTYTWSDLDAESDWQVVESDIPAGYTVSISLDSTTFTITNKNSYAPPEDSSSGSETDNNSNTSSAPPGTTDSNSGGSNGNDSYLPQTGQLWWPVPIMLLAGAALLLIGMIAYRVSDDDE